MVDWASFMASCGTVADEFVSGRVYFLPGQYYPGVRPDQLVTRANLYAYEPK